MENMINTKLLKQLRNQKHWSQEELATASGLSHRTVQRIESSGNCSLESKRALAGALEIETNKLEIQESTWKSELQLLRLPQHASVIVYFLLATLIILVSIFAIRNYQKGIELNFVIKDKHGVYTNTLNIKPPFSSTKVIELHNGYSLEVDYIFGITPRLKTQLFLTSSESKTLVHSSNRIYSDFPPVKYEVDSHGNITFISPFTSNNSESST